MTRAAIVAAIALAAPALAPAGAEAGTWRISQSQAELFTKQAAHQEYGTNRYRTGASCAPKGQSRSGRTVWPGRHHSWVCGWAVNYADESCGGRFSIKGTRSRKYDFEFVVLNGMTCESL